jgi:hypothetical protein
MRLRDHVDDLHVIFSDISERTNIPIAYIEKDFWLTEALRRMAAIADAEKFTLLFKGGTSLSKAYKLIQRFSEDVDLLVVMPTGTKGEQDRLLRHLIEEAAASCGVSATTQPSATTKGVKRAARLHFPSSAENVGTSNGLLIELGSRGGAMPHERLTIRSLVAELSSVDISDVEEVAPFEISVLSPVRTLVEKLVLLHTAHTDGDVKRINQTARHYYDIHELLAHPNILEELVAYGIDALARDIVTYSSIAELPATARPADGFANSPAFTARSATVQQAKNVYGDIINQFVWPDSPRPSFDACIERIQNAATFL